MPKQFRFELSSTLKMADNMRRTSSSLYSLWRLLPFFVTSVIYILHFDKVDQSIQETIRLHAENPPTYFTAFLKCCPLFCLIVFVAAQEEPKSEADIEKKQFRYKAGIAAGLCLGCIGDAFLVFPETFVLGMIAFALGHVSYIYSLGFKPLRLKLGVVVYTISTVLLLLIRAYVPDPLIKDAMPFYSLFLTTMCWRSLARLDSSPWRRIGALAGPLFVFSDLMIVIQFQSDIPYGELIVMTTYYSSQMCMALSVLDTATPTKHD